MDKDIRKVLEGITKELDSLTDSSGKFEKRLGKVEGSIATMEESRKTLHSSDSSDSEEAARLHEQTVEENARLNDKVVQLEERNVFLEGSGYQNSVIQGFLRGMDADNFHAIGIKLGYLEDTELEPGELQRIKGAGPVEVPLGENLKLLVSKDKPEDMTGWEHSETQDLYIKVE